MFVSALLQNFFLLLPILNRIDSIPASEKAGHCDLRILRLKRIANTSGVRTHRKNERFSLAPVLLILLLGKPHTPFMSKLKILPELFGKVLAFIRFDDYNYTVIL